MNNLVIIVNKSRNKSN